MKKYSFFLMFILLFSACREKNLNPDHYLSKSEQEAVIYSLIRYAAKMPKRATHETKFDARFDDFYKGQAASYKFEYLYYKGEDYYFLISRPASSIKVKRVGIAGRFSLNEEGGLEGYEEVFRMWKMEERELKEKGLLLLKTYLDGKPLEPYYPLNSKEEYIEFPDGRTYFSTTERLWKLSK